MSLSCILFKVPLVLLLAPRPLSPSALLPLSTITFNILDLSIAECLFVLNYAYRVLNFYSFCLICIFGYHYIYELIVHIVLPCIK